LLPLANPRTAADLVRIGAGLMRSGGTLTALASSSAGGHAAVGGSDT
jgi:hypothetical protein